MQKGFVDLLAEVGEVLFDDYCFCFSLNEENENDGRKGWVEDLRRLEKV